MNLQTIEKLDWNTIGPWMVTAILIGSILGGGFLGIALGIGVVWWYSRQPVKASTIQNKGEGNPPYPDEFLELAEIKVRNHKAQRK